MKMAATGDAVYQANIPKIMTTIMATIACLTRDPWLRAGSLVLAASALGILGVLYWTRRNRRGLRPDLTFEEYCRLNREVLDGQIRLIRRVLWWYIAPSRSD